MKKTQITLFVVAAGILSTQSASRANGILGVAQDYNAFIFQNMNEQSDSQGALAVGGNLTLTSYSVASSLGATGTHLVVGGNFTMSGGSINGDSYIGGNANLSGGVAPAGNVYVEGNYTSDNQPRGTVYYAGTFSAPSWAKAGVKESSISLPINFSDAETYLTATSGQLATLADNGSYDDAPSSHALTFTGTVSGLNIFSIDASVLDLASQITINLPTNGYAVINVTGSSVDLPNKGFTIDSSDVLWNLPQATSVSLISWDGSILAPSAAVSFPSGDLNGTLVAKSLNDTVSGGNGELHNVPFTQNILIPSDSPAVPLPGGATGGLVLLGGVGVIAIRRHRKNSL